MYLFEDLQTHLYHLIGVISYSMTLNYLFNITYSRFALTSISYVPYKKSDRSKLRLVVVFLLNHLSELPSPNPPLIATSQRNFVQLHECGRWFSFMSRTIINNMID